MADKCAATHCWHKPSVEYGGEMLCKTHARSRQRFDERRAKFHLDAAAPDLLAACEELLACFGDGIVKVPSDEAIEQARAAIAKAKGERA